MGWKHLRGHVHPQSSFPSGKGPVASHIWEEPPRNGAGMEGGHPQARDSFSSPFTLAAPCFPPGEAFGW